MLFRIFIEINVYFYFFVYYSICIILEKGVKIVENLLRFMRFFNIYYRDEFFKSICICMDVLLFIVGVIFKIRYMI